MNTYKENLRATVVESLRSQEMDLLNMTAQQNVSLYTMYHAQSAVMTDAVTLQADDDELAQKATVKIQGVECANIATNQLAAAKQSNTYVATSQTNSAVCAANVTAAANSVLRLAGDIGGIYSNLQASLRDSPLNDSGTETYDLINITAQLAEFTSEVAMNASAYIAEVASSAVQDLSKATNSSMQNLLKVVTSEYATAATIAAKENDVLAAAKVAEKAAEGNFEDLYTDYVAASNAFTKMNKELNMALTAQTSNDAGGDPLLTVSFNILTDPFLNNDVQKVAASNGVIPNYNTVCNLPMLPTTPNYPVDAYYLFFVKNTEKYTFSTQNAESIIAGTNLGCYMIDCTANTDAVVAGRKIKGKLSQNITTVVTSPPTVPTITLGPFDPTLCADIDGDPVTNGTDYVVFIMAIYSSAYKKHLNDFSDLLSAASPMFTPAALLPVAKVTSANAAKVEFECPDRIIDLVPATAAGAQLRVMLLPKVIKGVDDLLPDPSFNDLNVVNVALGVNDVTFSSIPGLHFTFNTQLACGVEAGNYIPFTPPVKIQQPGSAVTPKKKSDSPPSATKTSYSVAITDNTTDIFGNPLDFVNIQYMITILTVATSDNADGYLPALAMDAPVGRNTTTTSNK